MRIAHAVRMQTNLTRLWTQDTSFEDWLSGLTRHLPTAAWSTLRHSFPASILGRVRAHDATSAEPPEVTLLITDLVNFSHLIETMGDHAAHCLIQHHNRLLRSCLRIHGGREATHTGDGVISAFSNPSDAVMCAIRIQHELRSFREMNPTVPLHARIGLHVGRPLPEEGRLFGAAVVVAVRVCSTAEPDSILISDQVKHALNEAISSKIHGVCSLKGLSERYRLHQLVLH